ncbi:GGDEF domain-containing protein [Ferrimonas gelatinilytica]|uniref:Uncharacterized protein n=1 Tax=Ferrimonas gelatinilytica TaxID=1255257 RepID=A0ABP9RWX8_9GAMM
MFGIRFGSLALLLTGLCSIALLMSMDLLLTQQRVNADRDALASLLSREAVTITELTEMFPVQYYRIESPNSEIIEQHGIFRVNQHWLGAVLPAEKFQISVALPGRQIEMGLDLDHYLAQSDIIRYGLLGTLVILFFLSLWLSLAADRRIWRQRNLLIFAIERLPSLTLPNALNATRGPFKPLAKAIIETREQLKLQSVEDRQAKEEHEQRARIDPITQLANRAAFNQDMENGLKGGVAHGQLVMLRSCALEEINQRMGKQAGDIYLATIAANLQRLANDQKHASLYRYSSSDFLLRLPDVKPEELVPLLEPIGKQLKEIAEREGVTSAGYIGTVPYTVNSRLSQLLIQLDTGVSVAQSQAPNSFFCMTEATMSLNLDRDRWERVIDDVLENGRVEFTYQPVFETHSKSVIYDELFVRFHNEQGQPLPTETLFAAAASYGKTVDLDKLIFNMLTREINRDDDPARCFGVNLANRSLNEPSFLLWLEQRLRNSPNLKGRLILEVSEHAIETGPESMRRWIGTLHKLGVRIAIEHFGQGLTSFRSLHALRPDFVKLTSHFTKGIDNNSNNRFFIKMLIDIAVRLEIKVIATHVEKTEEKTTLEALRLDGLQGHLLAATKPLTEETA